MHRRQHKPDWSGYDAAWYKWAASTPGVADPLSARWQEKGFCPATSKAALGELSAILQTSKRSDARRKGHPIPAFRPGRMDAEQHDQSGTGAARSIGVC